jgi:HupE / UreJ protein
MKKFLFRCHPGQLRWGYTAALILATFCASAHTFSTSYLTLNNNPNKLTGEWHLALRDLEDAVGLDMNDDGVITWAELSSRKEAVSAYALSRLHIQGDGVMGTLHINQLLVDDHSDGTYAVLRFDVDGLPHPTKLEIGYHALFDIDPKHRGLVRLEDNGVTRLAVFGPENATQSFDLTKAAPRSPFLTFLNEGIWHIWNGYDHIMFLVALLLPGVLVRRDGKWQPVPMARPAIVNILKIVTAFTVAHSITLSLSALGYVHLPSRLVESAIAASVVLAAFNNLVPFFAERGWMVAFAFGLLHGFGFANALRDLGLHASQLAATLFGFNLGVEIGQLAIVAVFFPLAYSLRGLLFYKRIILQFGSAAIMVIASTWMAERVFDFKWLPF